MTIRAINSNFLFKQLMTFRQLAEFSSAVGDLVIVC